MAVIQGSYVHGVSTRSVDDLVRALRGAGMSKSQVSRLCGEIDERVPSEAQTFWTGFLRSLADRALHGVKLVVADDHKGLRAAVRRVFDATHQRCRVHWMRNALAHSPARSRPAVAAMLKTIFAPEAKTEAEAQWDTGADALREKQARLAEMMDASREDVLAYLDVPRDHWTQISSMNPLERVQKRRSSAALMSWASSRTMTPSCASSAR